MSPGVVALAAACLLGAACTDATTTGGSVYPELVIGDVTPTEVLPGTRLHIAARGLVAEVARYRVSFAGTIGGRAVSGEAPAELVDAQLVVAVPESVVGADADGAGTFAGRLEVERETDDGAGDARATRPLSLQVRTHLTAFATALEASELYPGERVTVSGGDALLPGEGTTLVRFDGTFSDATGVRPIDGLVVPTEPADAARLPGDRSRVAFALTPDVLGIRPGTFSGEVRLVDAHADGVETTSPPLAVAALALRAPRVTGLTPAAASRGQRITISGRGFLPADGLQQTATVFLLDGVFTPRRGLPTSFEGARALAIYPDAIGPDAIGPDAIGPAAIEPAAIEPDAVGGTGQAVAVLRTVLGEDGRPTGFGATPGRFVGRLTPVLLSGPDAIAGTSLAVDFTVLNPKQVVHIRLLPGFSDALVRFGLLAEKQAVLARVLEVLTRDYAGINIAFGYDAPTDWAEYEVVEVGGKDPNGTALLGLDNTSGKDVGNLRFDDVIGGFNADTRAHNFAAYGGIFAEEILSFSPTLGASELASPRFDDIFRDVVPELGGKAARVGESDSFDERGVAIRKAVRVLGNLIGTTITHEVGHSLGLTALDGRYHNDGDNPGWIMDAGQFRPFEERAEIDGQGPGVFEPFNRTYLESILPLDPEGVEPQ
ncbi:MAG: hypothetical protein U1F43_26825 [Myxococcota bacterium]